MANLKFGIRIIPIILQLAVFASARSELLNLDAEDETDVCPLDHQSEESFLQIRAKRTQETQQPIDATQAVSAFQNSLRSNASNQYVLGRLLQIIN